MDNCFCCDGKSFNFIPYDNHLSTLKRFIRLLIRRILYLIIPRFFYHKIDRYLFSEALFGMWAINKVKVCDYCGAGQIKIHPHEKELILWFNTKGSVVKKGQNIRFIKSAERSLSQFEYLSRYIKIDDIRNSLEYGSGEAFLSKIIKKEIRKVTTTTVDISDRTNKFLKKSDYVDFIYNDLNPADININDRFDIIFCSHILPFVLDFQTVWANLINKLKRGGYIFIEHKNANKDYYLIDSKDNPNLYFFSYKSLTELASNSGLNIVDISHFGHTWSDYVLHKKGKMYFENNDGIFLRAILQKS